MFFILYIMRQAMLWEWLRDFALFEYEEWSFTIKKCHFLYGLNVRCIYIYIYISLSFLSVVIVLACERDFPRF